MIRCVRFVPEKRASFEAQTVEIISQYVLTVMALVSHFALICL